MSYTKRTDVPCEAGELIVALESGELVAAQCPVTRDPQSNRVVFAPQARWIAADGTQQADGSGRPVITSKTHTVGAEQVDAIGASVIVRECLYLVLGEPLTPDPEHPDVNLMLFSADNIAQCSIRNAIAASSVATPSASEVL